MVQLHTERTGMAEMRLDYLLMGRPSHLFPHLFMLGAGAGLPIALALVAHPRGYWEGRDQP